MTVGTGVVVGTSKTTQPGPKDRNLLLAAVASECVHRNGHREVCTQVETAGVDGGLELHSDMWALRLRRTDGFEGFKMRRHA